MKFEKVEKMSEEDFRVVLKENLILRGFYNDGYAAGRAEARQEGAAKIFRLQLQAKFGELPPWALAYLQTAQTSELEAASLRVLKAATLEEVLHAPKNGVPKKARSRKHTNGATR